MAFGYGMAMSVEVPAVAVMAGVVVGTGVAVALTVADANGQLGASWVPQLGAFGTPSGMILTITGGIATVLGIASVFGHGPLKNNRGATGFAASYGLSAIVAQLVNVLLGTPATTTPAALAARRGFIAGRRAAPSVNTNARPFRGALLPYGRTIGV